MLFGVGGRAGPLSILEIGCGTQPVRVLPGERYWGLEIDDAERERAIALHPESTRTFLSSTRDLENLPAGSIDLIVGIFVFHFPFPKEDFASLMRVLSEEGAIVFNLLQVDVLNIPEWLTDSIWARARNRLSAAFLSDRRSDHFPLALRDQGFKLEMLLSESRLGIGEEPYVRSGRKVRKEHTIYVAWREKNEGQRALVR